MKSFEVFIDWADGMKELEYITEEEEQDYCVKLNAPMYGKIDVLFSCLNGHLQNN
jgi:hypothetical protein